MTTFNDRTKGFEGKFAHDEELNFKITARRNKLLGDWVAGKLGKTAEDADSYAKDVVMSDFEKEGDDDVVEKVMSDLSAANISLTEDELREQMAKLMGTAREQIISEKE